MTTVFLGGTCNGSLWRDTLAPLLSADVEAYNPVVPDWTPAHQKIEIEKRKTSDYCLYVITPKMTGFYSVAEVADDSNKRPQKTMLCVLNEDEGQTFTPAQAKSLKAVEDLVFENGGLTFANLVEVAKFLN